MHIPSILTPVVKPRMHVYVSLYSHIMKPRSEGKSSAWTLKTKTQIKHQ